MNTPASTHRTVAIPEGLAGERLDAALSRIFGFSRTRAAELIGQSMVRLDGQPVIKSERVLPGALLEVEIPVVSDPLAVVPEIAEGIRILHDDDALVVIDKPVGVAVHPSPGWKGRLSSGTWPRRVSGSRPAEPPSARASCNAWTSAPRA